MLPEITYHQTEVFHLSTECRMQNKDDQTYFYKNGGIPDSPIMSDKIFRRFSTFIHTELGIKMPEVKKTMLQARIQKRLRKLGIPSFDEYYDYVFSSEGVENELPNMIDVVTTNKTDFFREPQHFDYLVHTILPRLLRDAGRERTAGYNQVAPWKRVRVWSAGCSTGEEVYTLAMVLSDFALRCPGFTFSVLGSDISTRVLKKAKMGIYEHERAKPIPVLMRKRYLLKSKDRTKKLVRIVPEIRAAVMFRKLNLMNNGFNFPEKMDIIFLRNVLIYFDRPTQESLLTRLCRYLNPYGYIFVGHSETLSGLNVPLIPVASTVYKKDLKE